MQRPTSIKVPPLLTGANRKSPLQHSDIMEFPPSTLLTSINNHTVRPISYASKLKTLKHFSEECNEDAMSNSLHILAWI